MTPEPPKPSSRVERRRDRRKAEIVRTATVLLSEHGYQGMNLEDVAERTDIAKATLYHYFSGKDELVGAVLEALTEDVNRRLVAQLEAVRGSNHLDQLRALIREQIYILTDTAPDVALHCLYGVLNQVSLWIRPSLPERKRVELREAVVETALRMFGLKADG